MSLDLPEIIRRYFGAQNAHDIDAMVACFASDARVRDEGHVHIGPDAIRAWKKETSAKYRITVEPVECGIEGKTTVVFAPPSPTLSVFQRFASRERASARPRALHA